MMIFDVNSVLCISIIWVPRLESANFFFAKRTSQLLF
jgi:hypothetical protein